MWDNPVRVVDRESEADVQDAERAVVRDACLGKDLVNELPVFWNDPGLKP